MPRQLFGLHERYIRVGAVIIACAAIPLSTAASSDPESCEVVTAGALDLGSMDDARGPAGITWVAVGTDGRFFAVSQNLPAAGVLVYDEDGEYAGTLGGAGEGPGEFERPWRITSTPTGEILVHDLSSATHVFAVDGTYGRTLTGVPMPAVSAVPVGDSLIAVHNSRARPSAAPDREVNLYSLETGDWVRGLGPSGELRPSVPQAVDLIGRSAAGDGAWLALAEDRRLEKWSSAGALVGEVDWGAAAADAGADGVGPAALWEDSTGSELWVMAAVPVGDEPAGVEPGQPLPLDHFDPSALGRRFDSVIAVLDPGTGEVLAVRRWDALMHGFLRDGRVVLMRESPEGWQWIQVLSLSMECPEAR